MIDWKNKEEARKYKREQRRRLYSKNREKYNEYLRQWQKEDREKNPEKYRQQEREYYHNNKKRKEGVIRHAKIWRKNNPEKAAEIGRNWSRRNPEKKQKIKRDHCNRFPERYKARTKISNYIREKKIAHPSTLKCSCGKQAAEYHHEDYSKPLDVIPLCKKCHTKRHNLGDKSG